MLTVGRTLTELLQPVKLNYEKTCRTCTPMSCPAVTATHSRTGHRPERSCTTAASPNGPSQFAEDHHNAYLGAAAHAMALLLVDLAIGLIRLAGHTQIKRTLEWIAADRTRILPLLAASRP